MVKCPRDIDDVEYDVTYSVRQRKKNANDKTMERFQREKIISLVLWIVTRLVFPISFKQQRIQRKMLLEHRRQRRRRQVFLILFKERGKWHVCCLLL